MYNVMVSLNYVTEIYGAGKVMRERSNWEL